MKKLIFIVCLLTFAVVFHVKKTGDLPLVAIANYGPHASLDESIKGLQVELAREGFIENKTVRYDIIDAGFNPVLIPQMIEKLKQDKPHVIVVMTTPVAQYAKAQIHDIPLIYNVITDPKGAGLIKTNHRADANMTGSSDRQNLDVFLAFVKALMPNAKRVGLLYAISESNDAALVNMMRKAAEKKHMTLVAIPVTEAREVPVRMKVFQDQVDLIYVGASGPIQPALPAIAQEAKAMGIPVFNVEGQAVRDGLALASFGVNYQKVGANAGVQVVRILKGESVRHIKPSYPGQDDYQAVMSRKHARRFGIQIPSVVRQLAVVE